MNTKLKNIRIGQKLTQEQLARLSNISLRNYQRIENGEQNPRVTTARLIADALKVSIEELFD